MQTIRHFELKGMEIKEDKERNLIPGNIHLYIGEEAVAVGACMALKRAIASPALIEVTVTALRKEPTRPDDGRTPWPGDRILSWKRRLHAHSRLFKR